MNLIKLFSVIVLLSSLKCQYISNPEAVKTGFPLSLVNPSVNDPLFFTPIKKKHGHSIKKGHKRNKFHKKAKLFLGDDVYYDYIKKIYINVLTGDYYDPQDGIIYRKVKDKTLVNGQIGPEPMENFFPEEEKSDPVHLPKGLRNYKKNKYQENCYECYEKVKYHDCDICYQESDEDDENDRYDIAEYFVELMNDHRYSNGLDAITINNKLNETAVIHSKYMKHRGYLNHDNFEANIATYKYGNEVVAFVDEDTLNDEEGGRQFFELIKHTPKHNRNILSPEIRQCGVGIYFDEDIYRFWGTIICVN